LRYTDAESLAKHPLAHAKSHGPLRSLGEVLSQAVGESLLLLAVPIAPTLALGSALASCVALGNMLLRCSTTYFPVGVPHRRRGIGVHIGWRYQIIPI